jgi:hypothetical protein
MCFVVPPALISKALLSKGVQDSEGIVRHGSLALALAAMRRYALWRIDGGCGASAAAGAAGRANAGGDETARAKAAFLDEAASILRRRMPDLQVIIAAYKRATKLRDDGTIDESDDGVAIVAARLLASYAAWLPDACSEARFDRWALLNGPSLKGAAQTLAALSPAGRAAVLDAVAGRGDGAMLSAVVGVPYSIHMLPWP